MKRWMAGAAAAFASACVLMGVGCSDSDDKNPVDPLPARLEGTVSTVEGTPIASAGVVLVDGVHYTVVAGPIRTDAQGRYAFEDPARGRFYVLVFHSDFVMFDRTATFVKIEDGQTIRHDFRMVAPELWEGGGYKLEGRVLDGQRGAPIQGAFVSAFYGMMLHSFHGISIPCEDVSDSTGHYMLERLPIAFDEQGNETGFSMPIVASKEGFAPYVVESIRLSEESDSTAYLDIYLNRNPGDCAIQGRLLFEGEPVAGIQVGLDYYAADSVITGGRTLPARRRGPLLGTTSTTDAQGRYRFTGLRPGFYTIDPAYLPDDGYLGPRGFTPGGSQQFNLAAGDSVDVPDIRLAKAIRPLAPVAGSQIEDPTPLLHWEGVTGATHYDLWYTKGYLEDERLSHLPGNEYVIPDPMALSPGSRVRWFIEAYRGDTLIAGFEDAATFVVKE